MKEKSLFVKLPSLQFFAAGDNNDLPVRRYERQFKDILQTVYDKRAYFGDFSAGGIEALDGIKESDTAFTIKTTDIPVVVGTYNTGAAVAFGNGTANSTRFGNRTEVIYTNTDVPYSANWAFHEGLDRFTVNAELDAAVADRLVLQAQAQTKTIDDAVATYLDANAGNTEALADLTEANILTMFNNLAAYYTDLEVFGQKVMKMTPALYNAIIAHPLVVREKGSTVDINGNTLVTFKGFTLQEVPTSKLPAGTVALIYVPSIGKTFTGISTTRSLEAIDFDGIVLQGAGKYGNFIPNDNRKAVTKVTLTVGP